MFDGLSVFLESWMLFRFIRRGNAGVDTIPLLQRSILSICTKIPFFFCTFNCKMVQKQCQTETRGLSQTGKSKGCWLSLALLCSKDILSNVSWYIHQVAMKWRCNGTQEVKLLLLLRDPDSMWRVRVGTSGAGGKRRGFVASLGNSTIPWSCQ